MVAVVTLTGTIAARSIGRAANIGTPAGGAVAICGASAALATVLGEASQAQLTLVLVAASAASAVAMSLCPALAPSLHLTDKPAGS